MKGISYWSINTSISSDLPGVGEVVVFRHPAEPDQAYVKRVAGLPGEQVELIEGDVVVDEFSSESRYDRSTHAESGL
ncbi:MAG: S26 family signal peptidase [Planctomycetaceae bacterium]